MGHYSVIKMLADSGYDMNIPLQGQITPLMLAAKERRAFGIVQHMVRSGAEINTISEVGQTALSLSIANQDRELSEFLLKNNANSFWIGPNAEESPFFTAIKLERIWAVELMCDHGEDISEIKLNNMSALMYAATKGFDDICMYLTLRVGKKDINQDHPATGKNIFFVYL